MLENGKLHSLDRSLNIVRVVKSTKLKWASHIVRMEEIMSDFKIFTGKTAETFRKV